MLTDMILWSLPVAALVFLGGLLVRRTWPAPEKKSYFTVYLAAVAVLLLIISVVPFWIPTRVGAPLGYRLAFVNGPVILGVLAYLALQLLPLWEPSRRDLLVVLVLILIAIPASRLPWSGDLLGFLAGTLVFVLLAWLIPRRGAGYLALLSLAGLVYLWIGNTVDRPALLVGNLWPVLSFVHLPLVVTVPAALLYRAVRSEGDQTPSTGLRLFYLALGGLVLGYFAYSIYWYSIWDHTSDGLGGIFYSLYGSVVAVAAGLVLTFLLPGWRRFSGIAFAVLVPMLFNQAFRSGWEISYHQLTENRADKIEAALERYYADYEHYPQELEQLSPRYLLRIPGPVILRTVGWCYRAGQDHYRLGTYYREFFSLPISFRIYTQSGNPPDEWACEEIQDYVLERFGR